MKFKTFVKAGFGFYVGWSLAKSIDAALGAVLQVFIKKDKEKETTK